MKAVDGHGERGERPGDVGPALKRGLAAVREGRPALLNVLCARHQDHIGALTPPGPPRTMPAIACTLEGG